MRQCSLNLMRMVRTAICQRRTYTALAHRIERTRQNLQPLPINLSQPRLDPFALVASELTQIRARLRDLLGSAHPGLTDTAEYFFLRPSVQLRSLVVLLFSHATNGLGQDWRQKAWQANDKHGPGSTVVVDNALQNPGVLHSWHPTMPDTTSSFSSVFELQYPIPQAQNFLTPSTSPESLSGIPAILPSQIHLGQIMEMIYIASLLHDGVYEGCSGRRKPGTKEMGNNLTILGGDFLLGRASAVLPWLGEDEVVELVAGIISNIVEGEILRMEVKTPKLGRIHGPKSTSEAWERYLKMTYLKSASLLAKGARASAVLGGCQDGDGVKEVAYVYGRNLGFTKQLMDDASDYEFGLSNVQPGMAAAPALYAIEEHPELLPIITRYLSREGDVECVIDCVRTTSGVERTRDLARTYGNKAKEALRLLPDSDAVNALETLVEHVVTGSR